MSSTPLSKRHWNSRWDGLPREIRLLILKCLTEDGCTLARLATVCREWQTELERHNFARIRLTPSRLFDFNEMTESNRALVRYIWCCLELAAYDCITPMTPIIISFQTLFSALSTWDPHGDLVLDISVYSPDDSEHWFKYLTFMPDTPSDMLDGCAVEKATSNRQYHDPLHGWVSGLRQSDPPIWAFLRMCDNAMDTWDDGWQSLSNRDPWPEYEFLFTSIRRSNKSLKRLVIFENFNQQYPATMIPSLPCDRIRDPNPAVARAVARASLELEHVAASYIADASHFFDMDPAWEWPNLTSLVLAMEPSTIQAWEAVMQQYDGWRLGLVEELLYKSAIKSHGPWSFQVRSFDPSRCSRFWLNRRLWRALKL
ncbi:hypothetical protein CMUS01_10568 [Colletotrichum musicola]|uniref:F-box domain-containing protein n=1 Tax=Colletotrichum musicola TaxID=2175873 RepID=A0A8H6N801_9PEZI|nr:hypothetical protein CMUS01_10568 [Colletotrichum musicola]